MDPDTLQRQHLHFLVYLAAPTGAPCPDGTPGIGHSPATEVPTHAASSAGANGTRGGLAQWAKTLRGFSVAKIVLPVRLKLGGGYHCVEL